MISAPGSGFALDMLRSTSFNLLQGNVMSDDDVDVFFDDVACVRAFNAYFRIRRNRKEIRADR